MSESANKSAPVDRLRARLAALERTIRDLQEQREAEIRRRRRNLLTLGVALSLLAHLSLMVYLSGVHRAGSAPGGGGQAVSVEFAVLQEPELSQQGELEFDDLVPAVALEVTDPAAAPSLDLGAGIAAASVDLGPSGSVPALTGAGGGAGSAFGGGGEGSTLGGGGAGTSFFGVSSRGTRFAYIVDVSGSMGQYGKIDVCMRELARSIEILPDFAYFYIVLYSNEFMGPPGQEGWNRAHPSTVSRLIRWLNHVDPSGGTKPQPAFAHVYSLEVRPDVIFFLTDGLIPPDTADVVGLLNNRGRQVVVNTIAFGDPTSQDLLRQIARQSGGVYRHVPPDGR